MGTLQDVPSEQLRLRNLQWRTKDISLRGQASKAGNSHSEMQQLHGQPCDCIQGVPRQKGKGTSTPGIHPVKAEEGTSKSDIHPVEAEEGTRCQTIHAILGRLPDCTTSLGEEKQQHLKCINSASAQTRYATQYQGDNNHCPTSAPCTQDTCYNHRTKTTGTGSNSRSSQACRTLRSHCPPGDHDHAGVPATSAASTRHQDGGNQRPHPYDDRCRPEATNTAKFITIEGDSPHTAYNPGMQPNSPRVYHCTAIANTSVSNYAIAVNKLRNSPRRVPNMTGDRSKTMYNAKNAPKAPHFAPNAPAQNSITSPNSPGENGDEQPLTQLVNK